MFDFGAMDTSGSFSFIAFVLVKNKGIIPNFEPHIASLKDTKERAITLILKGFNKGLFYGVCLKTKLYRIPRVNRRSKKAIRRDMLSMELNRIKQHLLSKKLLRKNMPIFADNEFMYDVDIIQRIFETEEIYSRKKNRNTSC